MFNDQATERTMQCINHTVPYGEEEAITEAFHRDGFVVVTDILTPEEIQEILNELWTSPRLLGGFDPLDSTTWESSAWPQQQQSGGRNFLSSANVYKDAASWNLEANEKLLRTQQLLYGRKDIMMQDLGRWGVMRPSANHPQWRTESHWLHWDQNPWTQPSFCKVQAIVCLTDSTATTGGFACVPGFHHKFAEWGRKHPKGSLVVNGKVLDETYGCGQPFPVPPDDECQAFVAKIMAPAGSAVIWDSRLPHQNFPNTDDKLFRVVHYTMMKPVDKESKLERRRLLSQRRIIMDALGEEGLLFPHKLTRTGRFVHCLEENEAGEGMVSSWPGPLDSALEEFGIDDFESFKEAVRLVQEAGQLEEDGMVYAAIKKHQRSMVLFPDIEAWHDAIFGG